MKQKQDLLEQVPLFAGISAAGIEELGAIADEVEVRAGTVLTHEGAREGFFFIVVEGTVRIERGGGVVNTIGAGEFFGEIALLDGGPRTATAVAETAVSPPVDDLSDVPRAPGRLARDPDGDPRRRRPATPRARRVRPDLIRSPERAQASRIEDGWPIRKRNMALPCARAARQAGGRRQNETFQADRRARGVAW